MSFGELVRCRLRVAIRCFVKRGLCLYVSHFSSKNAEKTKYESNHPHLQTCDSLHTYRKARSLQSEVKSFSRCIVFQRLSGSTLGGCFFSGKSLRIKLRGGFFNSRAYSANAKSCWVLGELERPAGTHIRLTCGHCGSCDEISEGTGIFERFPLELR